MPRFAELLPYLHLMLVMVLEHQTAFHNDINALQEADVRQRITADSDPRLEFEETLHKAAGMIGALGTELLPP